MTRLTKKQASLSEDDNVSTKKKQMQNVNLSWDKLITISLLARENRQNIALSKWQ